MAEHPYRRTPVKKRVAELKAIDQDITTRVGIDAEDPEYKAIRLSKSPAPRRRGAVVLNKKVKPPNTA